MLGKILKLILSNQKLMILILLSIVFLLLTQVTFGQTISKTTAIQDSLYKQSSGVVCIPSSLADTIIHDLEERKLLLKQKDLYISMNQTLREDADNLAKKNIELSTELSKLEIEKEDWKTKARIRGWQRNGFIVGFFALAVIFVR